METDHKPRLLIVSYLFPPNGGIGVQRALRPAKYLPANGFEVHILKAWNAASPVDDPGLLQHVPPSVRVHNAFTPEIPFHLRHWIWKFMSRPGKPPARPSAAGLPYGLIRAAEQRADAPAGRRHCNQNRRSAAGRSRYLVLTIIRHCVCGVRGATAVSGVTNH